MNSDLDQILTTFLYSDREDCGTERMYLMDLFERSSRNMTIGGYDNPEDYYRQNVPEVLLKVDLNDDAQMEIIERLVARMREVPEREDLLWLMCKLRYRLLFHPVWNIVGELSDRFGMYSKISALHALNDVLGWPEEGCSLKDELMTIKKLDQIKKFVIESTHSDDPDIREAAESTKQFMEAHGITSDKTN